MEQQEVNQEQKAVVREERLGSGKPVIRNPNHHHHHHHHLEERSLE
jgi:hypothetical protein